MAPLLFRVVERLQRSVECRSAGARAEQLVGFALQCFEQLADAASTQTGIEQGLAYVALAGEQRVAAFAERDVIEPEHVLEQCLADATQQSPEHALVQGLVARPEQGVLAALAPDQLELVAVGSADARADAQIRHAMQVCVARLLGNAVEQPGDGAERGALACLVVPVDDVQPRLAAGKINHAAGKRPKRRQLERKEAHG